MVVSASAPARVIPAARLHAQVAAARHELVRRWRHHAERDPASVPFPELASIHAAIAEVAVQVSGTTLDGPRRAIVYHAIFEESFGNLMFPMVAAHGSLWGVAHTRRIDAWLTRLEPLSRHGRVRRWLDALDDVRDVNRRVFREIYTTFVFTRHYGDHPDAPRLVKPAVLALYNEVHAAAARGIRLPYADRRRIYFDIFVHEQHDIVDPGILAAADACGSPWLVRMLRHVKPRFAYFPPGERLHFTDFTSVDQRNREGLRACDLAERVGATRVLEAQGEY